MTFFKPAQWWALGTRSLSAMDLQSVVVEEVLGEKDSQVLN